MITTNGIAPAPARFAGASVLRATRLSVVMVLASAALAACGGGAATTDNPITSVTPTSTYNGPPPTTADVQAFKLSLWDNIETSSRCGGCHTDGTGQNPMFARHDDVNLAYEAANTVVDLGDPANSRLVAKVGGGHNCWLTDDSACADIMTTWIENWSGTASGSGREIQLVAPPDFDPGSSRNFANATVANFEALVYTPILTEYCAGCHSSQAPTSQQPYFAEPGNPDAGAAFDAARPKMNLDDPAVSRFVIRLRDEFHNCWDVGCAAAAVEMQAAIQALADTVPLTELNPLLVNSQAMRIVDGTIASGGNRYEAAQIALWEFKTGSGSTAFDTSGVEPAINLNLTGEVSWFGGWGITINDGKAQGSTSASKKLHDLVKATGEYSIEAWVVPSNVTQEMARIVSYSAGNTARNFTLQQTLYDYDFLHRSTETSANGDPQLSTPAADEVLQATLQHVVATYSPTEGRKIFVNGVEVTQPDPVPTGSLTDWQDTFAFVIGNEASGDGLWQGTFRLVAVHNRALAEEQILQNFDVGVGEKFFLLFSIENIVSVPTAYILFEVSQFDSWGYLFNQAHFITLDATQQPPLIPLQGMRIGINGAEATVGQSYANMDTVLDVTQFGELGQPLSPLGAVIALEKGPEFDEFFLTFDLLGSATYARTYDPPLVIVEGDLPPAQRFGVRTFDEINASMASLTTVDPGTPAIEATFQLLRQSLPAIEQPQAFVSSHQVAIAQMAIEYCSELIDDSAKTAALFPSFDFDLAPSTAFAAGNRNLYLDPLVDRMMGVAILTQPDFVDLRNELGDAPAVPLGHPGNLVNRLLGGGSPSQPVNTRNVAKGVCAAVLGSAVTLVQ